jgi:hypothetical protein
MYYYTKGPAPAMTNDVYAMPAMAVRNSGNKENSYSTSIPNASSQTDSSSVYLGHGPLRT